MRKEAHLATHDAGISEGEGHAGVALVPHHSGRADALARDGVAHRRVGAVARPARREPEVARAALRTRAANHVLLAGALAPKALALKGQRPVDVALAGQGAVVVLGGQRKYGLLAQLCGSRESPV